MARKRKIQIEKYPGVPRGAEHLNTAPSVDPTTGEISSPRHPRLDAAGREITDPNPVALKLNKNSIFSAEELHKRRMAIAEYSGPLEPESIEEMMDFEVDDDFGEFSSVWEQSQDDIAAIEDYKHFKATGEIPHHMERVLQKTRERHSKQAAASQPQNPSGTPGKPGESGVP